MLTGEITLLPVLSQVFTHKHNHARILLKHVLRVGGIDVRSLASQYYEHCDRSSHVVIK